MRNLLLLAIFILSGSSFLNAQNLYCGGGAFYRFTDSSVPPEYHRSYVIRIECNKVCFTVDSYGDTLLNEEYTIDAATTYKDFIEKLSACKLKKATSKKDNSCDGGTADYFFIQAFLSQSHPGNSFKFELAAKGSVYHCGGIDYGEIKGKVEDAKKLFRSMVPDFENKLNSTRVN